MIKKMNIGDIQLNNNTVRESLMVLERAMSEQRFMAMEEVTIHTLLLAQSEVSVRKGLEILGHSVIADMEILNMAKDNTMQRRFEIEDHTFFKELMKRMERNGKRLFLLGETKGQIAELVKYLLVNYPKIAIAGTGAIEDCVGADDALVNNINGLAPDAIVCLLHSPAQEMFLLEHKKKLFTNIWYGMGEIDPTEKRPNLATRLRQRRKRRNLEKIIKEQGKKRHE